LASHFPDRTVVTYDPRGLGRSNRKDGRVENAPNLQARDLHALIEALGAGPVEMFASSGGAVTALALVAAYPRDVTTLVAHEPPLLALLPDAKEADRAEDGVRNAYEANGRWAGMATFIRMTSWQGEFNDKYFAQPPADPTQFGMPADDDGSRDDPLLSGRSRPITAYRPDVKALSGAPTRIVIGVGEESQGTVTWRTFLAGYLAARYEGRSLDTCLRLGVACGAESEGTFPCRGALAVAERLGTEAAIFPSHHGGFVGPEMGGYAGKPEEFARKLREVLDSNKAR